LIVVKAGYRVALLAACLLAVLPASADSEVLSFRLTSTGEVEAVVSGLLSNECGYRFNASAPSVTVTATTIAIVTPDIPPPPCFTPIVPPRPYEVAVNLGILPSPRYSATWTQGPFVLTALLTTAALAPRAVPTLGGSALFGMALLVLLAGAVHARRR